MTLLRVQSEQLSATRSAEQKLWIEREQMLEIEAALGPLLQTVLAVIRTQSAKVYRVASLSAPLLLASCVCVFVCVCMCVVLCAELTSSWGMGLGRWETRPRLLTCLAWWPPCSFCW